MLARSLLALLVVGSSRGRPLPVLLVSPGCFEIHLPVQPGVESGAQISSGLVDLGGIARGAKTLFDGAMILRLSSGKLEDGVSRLRRSSLGLEVLVLSNPVPVGQMFASIGPVGDRRQLVDQFLREELGPCFVEVQRVLVEGLVVEGPVLLLGEVLADEVHVVEPAVLVLGRVVEHQSKRGVDLGEVRRELRLFVWNDRSHDQSLRLLLQEVVLELLVVGKELVDGHLVIFLSVVPAEVVRSSLNDEESGLPLVLVGEVVDLVLEGFVHLGSRCLGTVETPVVLVQIRVGEQSVEEVARNVVVFHEVAVPHPHASDFSSGHPKINKRVEF